MPSKLRRTTTLLEHKASGTATRDKPRPFGIQHFSAPTPRLLLQCFLRAFTPPSAPSLGTLIGTPISRAGRDQLLTTSGSARAPRSASAQRRLANPADRFYSHPLPCLQIGGGLKIIFRPYNPGACLLNLAEFASRTAQACQVCLLGNKDQFASIAFFLLFILLM